MRATLLACLRTGRMLLGLDDLRASGVQLVKLEAARLCLRAVLIARSSVAGLLALAGLLGCVLVGALLLHAALFFLLPCSPHAKAMVALGLGVAELALGWLGLYVALRPERWARESGALDLLRDAADRGP